MQPLRHLQQLGDLALQQLADRDVRPARHDLGDLFGPDLFLQEHAALQHLAQLGLGLLERRLQPRQLAVLQLGCAGVVVAALGGLDIVPRRLDLLLDARHAFDHRTLAAQPRVEAPAFLLQIGQLALDGRQALLGCGVALLLQRLPLDLKLHDLALDLVQLGRVGGDLHPQAAGGLVDQIDGLVGQEAVGDVAVRQRGRGDHGRVGDAHVVMHLVALLQPAEDGDGVLDGRLVHQHRLEAPFERRVLLDVLAEFVQRRRADGVQLAARQHRLEHVAGVHRALGRARADHGVQLVDEQDDLPGRVGDLFQHGLEPLLELAAILCAGNERAHVERDHALLLQPFGHVAADDALRQPLDDGGLAHAWLADEHGVVLGAPAEDLDGAADLLVAADDRVELAAARDLGQIAAVFLQRFVGAFRVLAGDALAAADRGERGEDAVARDAEPRQQFRRAPAILTEQRQQQMLGADVVVTHRGRLALGILQDARGLPAQAGLGIAAVDLRPPRQVGFEPALHGRRVRAGLLQDLRHHPFWLLEQRQQQVLRLDLVVVIGLRELLGGEDRLLPRWVNLSSRMMTSAILEAGRLVDW